MKLMKGGFVASVAIQKSPPGQLGKGCIGSRGLDRGTWARSVSEDTSATTGLELPQGHHWVV